MLAIAPVRSAFAFPSKVSVLLAFTATVPPLIVVEGCPSTVTPPPLPLSVVSFPSKFNAPPDALMVASFVFRSIVLLPSRTICHGKFDLFFCHDNGGCVILNLNFLLFFIKQYTSLFGLDLDGMRFFIKLNIDVFSLLCGS